MFRSWFHKRGVLALGTAALLLLPGMSFAQRGIGGYPGYYGGYDYPYYSGYYAPPAVNLYADAPSVAPLTPPSYPGYYPPQAASTDRPVQVTVRVPPNAEVWFGDARTTQTGTI